MTLCDDVSNDPLKLEAANTFIGPTIMPKPIPSISNATESQAEFVAPFITIKMYDNNILIIPTRTNNLGPNLLITRLPNPPNANTVKDIGNKINAASNAVL